MIKTLFVNSNLLDRSIKYAHINKKCTGSVDLSDANDGETWFQCVDILLRTKLNPFKLKFIGQI